MTFGSRGQTAALAVGYSGRHRSSGKIEMCDRVEVSVRVIHEHVRAHGHDKTKRPPDHVCAAIEIVTSYGAHRRVGNECTEWIIALRKAKHIKHPKRSWDTATTVRLHLS